MANILKLLKLMKKRGAVLLDTESVLGSPFLGYTGQPDKLWVMENKNKDGFGIVITDWKTNQPKNFEIQYYTRKMFPPFNGYHDTALTHYYLQLPLYARLLLKMLEGTKYENIKLYGCIIVHLKEDSDFEEYRVPKDVIDTILNMDMNQYLTNKPK